MNLRFEYYSLLFQLAAGSIPLVVLILKQHLFRIEFVIYLISSFLATLVFVITSRLKINDLLVFNLYQAISVITISIFYYNILISRNLKYVVLFFSFFWLLAFSLELSKTSFIEYSLNLKNITFLFFSIIYFSDVINHKKRNDMLSNTYILIVSSFFTYNCFSFLLIFKITQLMINDLWYLHNVFEGLYKLAIAYSFWKIPKKLHI